MGNLIYIQTDNNRVFTHKTNVCEFLKKVFKIVIRKLCFF